jgi:hypothetical protein
VRDERERDEYAVIEADVWVAYVDIVWTYVRTRHQVNLTPFAFLLRTKDSTYILQSVCRTASKNSVLFCRITNPLFQSVRTNLE